MMINGYPESGSLAAGAQLQDRHESCQFFNG
jgi:hypothetical protein